jgi:putative transposase
MGIAEPDAGRSWKLVKRSGQDFLVFTKLGNVPVVLHRALWGKAGTATIKRDGDAWFVSITCELDTAPGAREQAEQAAKPVVGLDRGVVNALADSTGHLEPRPAFLDAGADKLVRAQKNLSRKKKGSKNRAKAQEKLQRAHRKVRRQRGAYLHTQAYRYAKKTQRGGGRSAEDQEHDPQRQGGQRKTLASGWRRRPG